MSKVAYLSGVQAGLIGAGALTNAVLMLRRAHARHGQVILVRLPGLGRRRRHTVLVADPLVIRGVLQQSNLFTNVALYPIRGPQGSAQRRLREGILHATGADHDRQRFELAPSLNRRTAEALEPRVREICGEEAEAWLAQGRGDLFALTCRTVRRVAIEVLFGEPDVARSLALARDVSAHLAMSRNVVALAAPLDWPGTPYRRLLRLAGRVEDGLTAWVRRRRDGPRGPDLMSVLLQSKDEDGAPISDEVAAARLWTLFGASFDTTAASLVWILFLLAQNPPAARRLLADLNASPDEPPVYLTQVIREGMRLCTPVPLQIRRAAAACELPGTGLGLQPGDHLILSDIVANRSDATFADPEAFRPERWADPALPDAAAMTFSAGPRNCIGVWFAMSVMRETVSALWRRLRIAVEPGAQIDFSTLITMVPARVPVRLTPQDGEFAAAPIRGPVLALAGALAGLREPLSAGPGLGDALGQPADAPAL